MTKSVQLNLPPAEVQRLDAPTKTVQKMDLDAMALQMAKVALGGALHRSIKRTESALKEFGDPSHVQRVCEGDISSVIARAWARSDTRREFVLALAEASGHFDTEVNLRSKRPA